MTEGKWTMGSDQCVFCKIIAGEIPSQRVLENDDVLAFRDVNPQAPTHVLVVPRRHVPGMTTLPGDDPLWNSLLSAAQVVARAEHLDSGFRVVVNHGADGGQTVDHLHLHVLGGRSLSWPPG